MLSRFILVAAMSMPAIAWGLECESRKAGGLSIDCDAVVVQPDDRMSPQGAAFQPAQPKSAHEAGGPPIPREARPNEIFYLDGRDGRPAAESATAARKTTTKTDSKRKQPEYK